MFMGAKDQPIEYVNSGEIPSFSAIEKTNEGALNTIQIIDTVSNNEFTEKTLPQLIEWQKEHPEWAIDHKWVEEGERLPVILVAGYKLIGFQPIENILKLVK